MTEHNVTIEPERDSDDLVVWRCSCGIWGTDYDESEADANIDAHFDEVEAARPANS